MPKSILKDQPDIRESKTPAMNIRILNPEDAGEKGVCYPETKQSWISLHLHIGYQDIYDTMIEEGIHIAIRDESFGMKDESVMCNIEQEEQMIEKTFWILADWY